ncbi:hypothetical protein U1Q18_003575 [Sarracenia purpurea var. burkii]
MDPLKFLSASGAPSLSGATSSASSAQTSGSSPASTRARAVLTCIGHHTRCKAFSDPSARYATAAFCIFQRLSLKMIPVV